MPPIPVSKLAPASLPAMPAVPGVRLGAAEAAIRYKGRVDVVMAEMPPGTTVAGVLTRTKCPSAPVDWCRAALKGGKARAVVVNAGNANAFTGKLGADAARRTAEAAAKALGCKAREVFLASTGVIGEPLPDEKIRAALPALRARLSPAPWADAARGIMTTDTYPKAATRTARIGDATVTINGIIKGSGMIAPDMGTMLGFVFTDAKLPAAVLQTLLSRSTETTFNCMTVDGDTSTSDTVLLFATGAARHKRITRAADPALKDFRAKLHDILHELCQLVVKDGEGIEKLITINVSGAVSTRSAKRLGLAIANSPLVKTAIAGEDANWGRIVMAVGKAGEPADRDKLSIRIGGVQVAKKGLRVPDYDEAPVNAHMKGRDIVIDVDIGLGRGKATVWTCDLTHGYIDINGSYRT
ncbi:MAG: bifunctional glutamate N-acetyltransferase/amino-acid acetyltransferase ArgJ [Alphaproteobacteria bacterium]|nr:bifunctional glutamate N-acetyltransferase/amino-acid acetyltransferase ArgJ [Alphaproteobacteria bacterium]